MKRVSSRQRLVSWDAFDAAASDSEEDDQDYVTCYDALSRNSSFAAFEDVNTLMTLDTTIQPLSRKREREPTSMKKNVSFSELLPVVITAHACEVHDEEEERLVENLIQNPTSLLPLDTLMDDVQLHVLSFLSVSEAREMALVSKQYRRLLHSKEAMTLWTEWFQRRWPKYACHGPVEFVDLLKLSAALVDNTEHPNMEVLMGMAASHLPTIIDKAAQIPPPFTRLRRFDATPRRTMFRTFEMQGRNVTQYLGPIGTGDRCIRADQPLAGPQRLRLWSTFANNPSILDILRRGAMAVTHGGSTPPWRPFVAPYVMALEEEGQPTQVNLTPRLVSYYEVSILACPDDSPLIRADEAAPFAFPRTSTVTDCVAVGIATANFHLHSRMPGWDVHSYGYHGDDGGAFHASGDMTRRFGPSFGQGDTVGCGVDYITGGIFFTLNGEFQGYGWTNVDVEFLQQDLYPTIGVDTNLPLDCNFGERPFAFDLSTIVERQKDVIQGYWDSGTSDSATPPTTTNVAF